MHARRYPDPEVVAVVAGLRLKGRFSHDKTTRVADGSDSPCSDVRNLGGGERLSRRMSRSPARDLSLLCADGTWPSQEAAARDSGCGVYFLKLVSF